MPVKYKIDVLAVLKDAGYTTYKMRQEKLLGESVLPSPSTAAHVEGSIILSVSFSSAEAEKDVPQNKIATVKINDKNFFMVLTSQQEIRHKH